MPIEQEVRTTPRCPICGGDQFRREKGKIDSEWGITAHKVDILVCRRCGYVLLFYEGNTIVDFDCVEPPSAAPRGREEPNLWFRQMTTRRSSAGLERML